MRPVERPDYSRVSLFHPLVQIEVQGRPFSLEQENLPVPSAGKENRIVLAELHLDHG